MRNHKARVRWGRKAEDREYNRRRAWDPFLAASARVHNSTRWKKLRADFRRGHPLCASCLAAGRTRGASEVDHVVPVALAPERAYDEDNLQALCRACHARKSQDDRRLVAAHKAGLLAQARAGLSEGTHPVPGGGGGGVESPGDPPAAGPTPREKNRGFRSNSISARPVGAKDDGPGGLEEYVDADLEL